MVKACTAWSILTAHHKTHSTNKFTLFFFFPVCPLSSHVSLSVWVSDRILKRGDTGFQGSAGRAERKSTQGHAGGATSRKRGTDWSGKKQSKSKETGGRSVCLFTCLFTCSACFLFLIWKLCLVWIFSNSCDTFIHNIYCARLTESIRVSVWYNMENTYFSHGEHSVWRDCF